MLNGNIVDVEIRCDELHFQTVKVSVVIVSFYSRNEFAESLLSTGWGSKHMNEWKIHAKRNSGTEISADGENQHLLAVLPMRMFTVEDVPAFRSDQYTAFTR